MEEYVATVNDQLRGSEAQVFKWRLLYWMLSVVTPGNQLFYCSQLACADVWLVVGKVSKLAGSLRAKVDSAEHRGPVSVYNYLIRVFSGAPPLCSFFVSLFRRICSQVCCAALLDKRSCLWAYGVCGTLLILSVATTRSLRLSCRSWFPLSLDSSTS